MTDLAGFLTARLDDDERYVRAIRAAGERFRDVATPAQFTRDTPLFREIFDGILDDPEAVSALAAVQQVGVPNDLDRLLREVEAKRGILAQHYVAYPYGEPDPPFPRGEGLEYTVCAVCVTDQQDMQEAWVPDHFPCATLRALAAVYSDHPDYNPEWKAS